MPVEIQFITVIFAFLITILFMSLPRMGKLREGHDCEQLRDEVSALKNENELLRQALGDVHAKSTSSQGNLSSNIRSSKEKELEVYQRLLAEADLQIAKQGGEGLANAATLLRRSDYADRIKLIEETLDEET